MHSTLAKLIALRDRVISVQELYSTPAEDIFVSLRDQFLKEADELKKQFPDLQDFTAENYERFHTGHASYYRWATRALNADIQYFIKFLNSVETVQKQNVKVTEEGVYFSGQHFDALLKFNDIIAKAKKEIILIDNYINEKILELLASKNNNVQCRILTLNKSLTPTLKTSIEAFNKQHKNLKVKTSSVFQDRFVVIDQTDFYHFGASISDTERKGLMFSKIDQDFIKDSLLRQIETEWIKYST